MYGAELPRHRPLIPAVARLCVDTMHHRSPYTVNPRAETLAVPLFLCPFGSLELRLVFDAGSSQAGVYERAVVSIVDQVVSGISCAIFAYGQTGAGKTHTMRGSLVDPQQHGIIQRGTLDLIEKLAKKEHGNFDIIVDRF